MGKTSAKLEFANYEDHIVKRLGVKLVGWPCSIFDIDSLGTQDLQNIESLIQDGTSRWISGRASERSSVAAPQTRRKRNTGPAAGPTSPSHRKKRRVSAVVRTSSCSKVRPHRVGRSRSVIDSSEDEEAEEDAYQESDAVSVAGCELEL